MSPHDGIRSAGCHEAAAFDPLNERAWARSTPTQNPGCQEQRCACEVPPQRGVLEALTAVGDNRDCTEQPEGEAPDARDQSKSRDAVLQEFAPFFSQRRTRGSGRDGHVVALLYWKQYPLCARPQCRGYNTRSIAGFR